tara:strand:- start:1459 stop:1977 length:519 start_codon:yes stop_codon:yes gene_type:complete
MTFAVALAVVALGVIGVLFFSNTVLDAKELKDAQAACPSVQGNVISPSVLSREKGEPTWLDSLVVDFAYDVEGRTYSGKAFWNRWCFNCNIDSAKKDLRNYAPGNSVSVRYNPSDPSEAVIRIEGMGLAGILFIALAVISGLAALLAGIIGLGFIKELVNDRSVNLDSDKKV